ncbi:STAS-like domain-containing protein [Caulobacter sp. FWC2]|uniref:STAS-like domain-containing protein n=1 Tax=Caulobacter sp. FWC2 TaxID=69664 RepID=UPI0013046FDA|nr:STAS-like domain-containing protein [Caulobacter sp. FWC2]
MGKPVVVNVADKFGRFAAGRYRSDGPSSGQEFREEIAEPALAGGADVVLNMDGMLAFPASFLDEAFGGLVREAIRQGEDAQALIARITIVSSEDPFVAEMARRCMMQAMKNYRP